MKASEFRKLFQKEIKSVLKEASSSFEAERDEMGNELPTKSEAYYNVLEVLRGMAATGEIGLREINAIERELRDARKKGMSQERKADPAFLEKQKKALEKAAATRAANAPSAQEKAARDKRRKEQEKEYNKFLASRAKLDSFKLTDLDSMVKFLTRPNAVGGLEGESISGLTEKDFKPVVELVSKFQESLKKGSGLGSRKYLGKLDPMDILLSLDNLKRSKPSDPKTIEILSKLGSALKYASRRLDTLQDRFVQYDRDQLAPKQMVPRVRTSRGGEQSIDGYEPLLTGSDTSSEFTAAYNDLGDAIYAIVLIVEQWRKTRDGKNFK